MTASCESCMYLEYDEEYDDYVCSVDMDEDEMYALYENSRYECPFYRVGDEYRIVRKQM